MAKNNPLPSILVDSRERTRPHPDDPEKTTGVDLLKLFQAHPTTPQCVSQALYAGDVSFVGHGKDGPVTVGVERKRIHGLIGDIREGRLSGEQLPKLLDPIKGYDYVWIVVEGTDVYRTNYHSGIIERRWGRQWQPLTIGRGVVMGLEIQSALNDIATCTPVKIQYTRDPKDTVEFVMGLAHSFAKPYESRHHHMAIHQPAKYVTMGKASGLRRIAYTLDGVGWEKSGEVEKSFPEGGIARACGVPKEHECTCEVCKAARLWARAKWGKTPGFGKVLSQRAWDQLHGVYGTGDME